MYVNLEWYRVFFTVAKEKQFSRAAEMLNITQPAVSQTIKQLEGALGGKLFARTPKGVVLTSEGKELFGYIEKAYTTILLGEARFNEIKDLESGELRIGASDTLCNHYLIDFLKRYKLEYPKIKIQVLNKTTYEIIDSLKKGEIDLGFINLPIKDDSSLEIKKVRELQDSFVCNSSYPHLLEGPISLSELVKDPVLLLEKGTNMRLFLDSYFSKNNVEYTPELELGSIELLTKFASQGFGISFVTKDFVKDELESGLISAIEVKEKIPPRAIGMISIKERPLTHGSKAFYDYFSPIY